jgi:peptidoglycan/xylan/chitin deacetylase (PgdA/CDA1 family)
LTLVANPVIDILMYHSISEGPGPTCMAPAIFRQQMADLAACGYRAIGLTSFAAGVCNGDWPVGKVVVLTFDDGFEDFATVAFPELYQRGWSATVFLPAAKMGGAADWEGAGDSQKRALMSWNSVRELAAQGIEFGAHGVHHVDLTTLSARAAQAEILDSKKRIEDALGRPVTSFAAPYGRTTPAVRREIQRHFLSAVGTTFARVRPTSPLHDLPRVEMHYFRDPSRWRSYVSGGSQGYFLLRQVLRRARGLIREGWPVKRTGAD